MTEQEVEELRRDMYEELKQEAYEECKMRSDIAYASQRLGLDDIHDEIVKLADSLCDYGYDVNVDDILEMLGDI